MSQNGLFINGQWTAGHGIKFASTDSADQSVIWEGNGADQNDVNDAARAAAGALERWAGLDISERMKYLQRFAAILDGQKDLLARTISRETGKPLWESATETGAMIRKIEISIRAGKERTAPVEAPMGEMKRFTRFKPHGVVAVIGPFNLPGHLPNGHIVPALLAGNVVLFKPSEKTPLTAEVMVKAWEEAGLPAGVLNLLPGAADTAKSILDLPDLAGVFFTGSVNTGNAIHRQFAGRTDVILALEMGGNNPLVVWDVKDLRAAAYLTIQSAFITAGQRCTCARRLIVSDDDVGGRFLETLTAMTAKVRFGIYSEQPEPFYGPLIDTGAAHAVLTAYESLRQKGAKILTALEPSTRHPALLSPGIVDVTGLKDIADIEVFGPLLQVTRVKDFDGAVAEANRTRYGLSAGLICDREDRYRNFFARARAGVINWNSQITGASSEAPFGGVGLSGNHRPSAYFAADYCAYPVASIESGKIALPGKLSPGLDI